MENGMQVVQYQTTAWSDGVPSRQRHATLKRAHKWAEKRSHRLEVSKVTVKRLTTKNRYFLEAMWLGHFVTYNDLVGIWIGGEYWSNHRILKARKVFRTDLQ